MIAGFLSTDSLSCDDDDDETNPVQSSMKKRWGGDTTDLLVRGARLDPLQAVRSYQVS